MRPLRCPDAGFVMFEAVIAIAIVALSTGAILAAVCAVQRATSAAQPRAALTLTAQNVLTDLRAATAYDARQLNNLGRSTAFDVNEPAGAGATLPMHVVVTVDRTDPAGPTIATVSVRDNRGQTVTVQGTIVVQAPAPQSIVPAGGACLAASCTQPIGRLTL